MFEREHFICIKMDLALIMYNGRYAIKPNQPTNFQTGLLVHKMLMVKVYFIYFCKRKFAPYLYLFNFIFG